MEWKRKVIYVFSNTDYDTAVRNKYGATHELAIEVRIAENLVFVCLIDLIIYVPSTIFQLNRDGSSWVEPVLS